MAPARHLPPSLRTTGLMLRGPTYRLSILTSHSNASAITSNSFSSFSSFSSSSHSKHTPSTPYSLPLSKPTSTSIPARQPTTSSSNSSQRLFSTSSISHSGGGHSEGDSFNPPGGWLWGIPPGEKYQREGWERIWGWGMGGVCVVAVVGWVYKPDTRYVQEISLEYFICGEEGLHRGTREQVGQEIDVPGRGDGDWRPGCPLVLRLILEPAWVLMSLNPFCSGPLHRKIIYTRGFHKSWPLTSLFIPLHQLPLHFNNPSTPISPSTLY